jgi:hypothetical protein
LNVERARALVRARVAGPPCKLCRSSRTVWFLPGVINCYSGCGLVRVR